MEVRCDKCQARYRVDDARIGPQGLTMRCGKCQNTFKVSRASAAEPAPAEPKPVNADSPGPAQTTMMFAAPATTTTPAAKPATPPPATAPPRPASAPPAPSAAP